MMLRNGLLLVGLAIQIALVLTGFRKRNLELSYSFFVYLIASFGSSVTISYLIQDSATSRLLYVLKEFALDAIKAAVLIEFNHRVFRFYPTVRRSNYGFMILTVLGLGLYLWLVPSEKGAWWGTIPLDVHAKVMQ